MTWDIDNDLKKPYRGRLEIIRDILLTAEKAGDSGSKKTHIMHGANLSYKLLIKYLDTVQMAGLIVKDDLYYIISDKGRKFLEVYFEWEKEIKEVEKHNAKLNNEKIELVKMLR